jgi:hypothetical protein
VKRALSAGGLILVACMLNAGLAADQQPGAANWRRGGMRMDSSA